jgi:hypothetical protein
MSLRFPFLLVSLCYPFVSVEIRRLFHVAKELRFRLRKFASIKRSLHGQIRSGPT